jgi:hypothetical protein
MGHASVKNTYDRYGHLMPANENEAPVSWATTSTGRLAHLLEHTACKQPAVRMAARVRSNTHTASHTSCGRYDPTRGGAP